MVSSFFDEHRELLILAVVLIIGLLAVSMCRDRQYANRFTGVEDWPVFSGTVIRSDMDIIRRDAQHGPNVLYWRLELGVDLDFDGNEDYVFRKKWTGSEYPEAKEKFIEGADIKLRMREGSNASEIVEPILFRSN